jgi:hypothetical protein
MSVERGTASIDCACADLWLLHRAATEDICVILLEYDKSRSSQNL